MTGASSKQNKTLEVVRKCVDNAGDCVEHAASASDPDAKASFTRVATRWLDVANQLLESEI